MMMGVAQVMGMKPTLSLVFSSGPGEAKASFTVPSGRKVEIAAIAVLVPTARMKLRRVSSCGNSARITAPSTTRSSIASSDSSSACSCSAWLW